MWGSVERCALAPKASAAPQWEKRRARHEGQRRVQRTSSAAQCSARNATPPACLARLEGPALARMQPELPGAVAEAGVRQR